MNVIIFLLKILGLCYQQLINGLSPCLFFNSHKFYGYNSALSEARLVQKSPINTRSFSERVNFQRCLSTEMPEEELLSGTK
jgi:hypothetical protein